jgi:hypothetical protein
LCLSVNDVSAIDGKTTGYSLARVNTSLLDYVAMTPNVQ